MKRKIAPIWSLAMMALLICFLTVQISGAETSEYKWEKVSFQDPRGLFQLPKSSDWTP